MTRIVLDLKTPSATVYALRTLVEDRRRAVPWASMIADDVASVADVIEAQTRPKTVEPTGMGAVVEEHGNKWVRVDNSDLPWREASDDGEFRDWDDFGAVRVLSEGVTA